MGRQPEAGNEAPSEVFAKARSEIRFVLFETMENGDLQ
jgi:hypothetical protein